jgi:hypothetical protein
MKKSMPTVLMIHRLIALVNSFHRIAENNSLIFICSVINSTGIS